jgi:hypothetical protein
VPPQQEPLHDSP